MKHFCRALAAFSLGASLLAAAPAFAQGDDHQGHGHDSPAAAAPAHGEHGDEHAAAHGEGHAEGHGDHAPTFQDINWGYGFLGEKDGAPPSLLWRPKGMPVPFGALALNAAILYWLLIKFGKKPISDALKARKLGIMKGMEEAGRMKAEAEASLAKYKKQLDEIDSEVERIRREMKEAGEAESARIVREAKERRERMEKDARTLVEQELKAARETLVRETVRAAVKSAEATLVSKIGDSDRQRLGDEFLASVKASGAALRGRL
jgi:F-type H+-transporting ATPase subunit b